MIAELLHRHLKLSMSKINLPSFPVSNALSYSPYPLSSIYSIPPDFSILVKGNNSMQSPKPDSWKLILPLLSLHSPSLPLLILPLKCLLNPFLLLHPNYHYSSFRLLTTHLNYCNISWLIFPPLILPYPNLFLSFTGCHSEPLRNQAWPCHSLT